MSYYKIQNFEQYFKHYNKSVREPRKFWGKIAEENFTWYQLWDKVVESIWLKQKLSGLPKQN
jgi:acetyl-CoA synthetase